jgi:hypothetical protein
LSEGSTVAFLTGVHGVATRLAVTLGDAAACASVVVMVRRQAPL